MSTPLALYARSRGLPLTLLMFLCAALFTLWAGTQQDAFLDPYRRVPLLTLAPLLTSAAIGTSLHQHAEELDRTAVRPWWRRRLAHLLALTGLAAAVLALAVPGDTQVYGAPAMIRNVLGATGITALAAVVIGARLSWLPAMLYFSTVYLSFSSPRMREATVLSWPMQTGLQRGAWAAALMLFALGGALYARRGARAGH
ncbi:hypothetical protein [Streptomyces sp. NBC_01445]|uniref:hypothetical protein n=1 Tax=Streptomyces sp. NBC_01445 TaxID=2903869 RepID=UPI002DDB512F|nr:hypothetical protein [Streptomyces sp. NBC_01445]WSE07162.1 hypothetical protein OG574_29830 [Streptomyces sp. NBC_01445]